MPPIMPYHLEKGPLWSVVESAVNGDAAHVLALLRRFRDPKLQLWETTAIDSTSLNYGPNDTYEKRITHIASDFLGMKQNTATTAWTKQPQFDAISNSTTGFWQNWYGDAEGIVRTTMQYAMEMSLGLAHGADPGNVTPTQCWPIEVFLKCPTAWMEGWVSWRKEKAGGGHVTVHILTPGHGWPVLLSPLAPPQRGGDGYASPPQLPPTGVNGMFVITHKAHERKAAFIVPRRGPAYGSTAATGVGDWQSIIPHFGDVFVGTGEIVAVSPSEVDGGVLPAGRPYVAPV